MYSFGPAKIGETVETIAYGVHFRGTLVALDGGLACIAVLGYNDTIKVPQSAVAPLR